MNQQPAQQQSQASQEPISEPKRAKKDKQQEDFSLANDDNDDVLRYSNVDLQAEEQLLSSTAYANTPNVSGNSSSPNVSGNPSPPAHLYPPQQHPSVHPASWCNVARLRYMAERMAASTVYTPYPHYIPRNGVEDADGRLMVKFGEEAVLTVAFALRQLMSNLLARAVTCSRHRVDRGRAAFKIKLLNDPRKQLGILEQLARRDYSSTTAAAKKQTKEKDDEEPEKGEERDKAEKSNPPASNAEAELISAAAVKAKLANTAAMAAIGLKKRSWMTADSANPFSIQSPTQESKDTAPPANAAIKANNEQEEQLSGTRISFDASPSVTALTDAQLVQAFASRSITGRDLLAAVELDPKLKHSAIAVLLMDLTASTLQS